MDDARGFHKKLDLLVLENDVDGVKRIITRETSCWVEPVTLYGVLWKVCRIPNVAQLFCHLMEVGVPLVEYVDGWTIAHICVYFNRTQLLSMVLNEMPRFLNALSTKNNETPLDIAYRRDDLLCVRILIDRGAIAKRTIILPYHRKWLEQSLVIREKHRDVAVVVLGLRRCGSTVNNNDVLRIVARCVWSQRWFIEK